MDGHQEIMDQQIDDLRERMRLLQQDRRANIDILEISKASNADDIRLLREENKGLRIRLSQLKKTPDSIQGGPQDISSIKKDVLSLRTEYDSLKVSSGKYKSQLDKLKDEMKQYELEVQRPSQGNNPLSRQIRTLENRLDKAMIKYNEAQSIKNTYEHIHKRLNDERVSFDNQLSALERTLFSKSRDYEELLQLAGDANHAREVAHQELQRNRNLYEDNRSVRETKIRERHQIVKVRKQLLQRQEHRASKRKELVDKLSSENDTNDEAHIMLNSSDRVEDFGMFYSEEIEQENKLDVYENAFRKIREATGVSDVNEVIQKIVGQENTTENLVSLTKQNQGRVEEFMLLKQKLKKSVEELKYSSSSSGQCKKIVDEKENQLVQNLSQLDQWKSRCERYGTNLISVTTGVRHLQNKIDNISNEVGGAKVMFSEKAVVDVLKASGEVLVNVLSRISRIQLRAKINSNGLKSKENSNMFDTSEILIEDEVQENRPFNQRVLLPSVRGGLFDNNNNCDDELDELDEEELSRDRVKKNSSQILQAQERKKRRERRRARLSSQT